MKRISTFCKIFSYSHILTSILHWTSHFQKLNHTLIIDLKKKRVKKCKEFKFSKDQIFVKDWRMLKLLTDNISLPCSSLILIPLNLPFWNSFIHYLACCKAMKWNVEKNIRIFQKVFSSLWLWNCLHDSHSVTIWRCVQTSVS